MTLPEVSLKEVRYLLVDDGIFWDPQRILSGNDLKNPGGDAIYLHNQNQDPSPESAIPFSTYDGMALKNIFHEALGMEVYVLSSENRFSEIIESRMKVLNIAGYFPNLGNRMRFLEQFRQKNDCNFQNLLYFGNDEAILETARNDEGPIVVTERPVMTPSTQYFSLKRPHMLRQFANRYTMELPQIVQLLEVLRQETTTPTISLHKNSKSTLILDIDGTCTDAAMIFATDGSRWKRFSKRDIAAIKHWNQAGNHVFFVTGENGLIPYRLAALTETPESHVFTDAGNRKRSIVTSLCQEYGVNLGDIAYVGDDINDFGVMEFLVQHHGWIACPSTAMPIIQTVPSVHILQSTGGNGAIAEAVSLFLKNT
ncbi:MAG: hypothetical protein LW808_000795 [Verrucomicrobiota bacterium]|nr:MAG: hypothetical protein LW808_000795 [Verrucomicrobiota bacterium]